MRWTAGITMRLMALTRALLRLGRTAAASLALIVASTVAAQAVCTVTSPTLTLSAPTTTYPAAGGPPAITVTAAVSYNITANNGSGAGFCSTPVEVTVTPTISDGAFAAPTCIANLTVPNSNGIVTSSCTLSWTAPASPEPSYAMTAAATSNAANGNFTITTSNTLTLTQLPPPTVNISGTATVTEGATSNVLVTLSAESEGDTVVNYSVDGTAVAGTDFNALSGSVTVLDGETTATIPVETIDNDIDQDTRTVNITLTSATNGAALGATTVATVSILDNDTAGISVTVPGGSLEMSEAGGTGDFTVVLTSQPISDVTITVTSGDENIATVAPTSLTFTDANWDQPQTVTVTGVNDLIAAGSRFTTISMSVSSSDTNYSTSTPAGVNVTVTDDDTAGVTVSKTSLEMAEDGGTDSFTVVLTSQPTSDVTITVASNDTTIATVSPISLTFTAANWSQPQPVTVTGVDDSIAGGNRSATVTMSASSDDAYDDVAIGAVNVTVTDDDVVGITVSPTALSMVEGASDSFSVVLSSQPAGAVQINLNVVDSSVATISEAALTFTTSDWATPKFVTVTGVDDGIAGDPDRNTTIDLSLEDPGSYPVDPADVDVTVLDIGTIEDVQVETTFEDVTAAFIGRRMDRIIAAEPEGYRLDRRRMADGLPRFSLSSKGDAGDMSLSYGRTSPDSAWYTWAEAEVSFYKDDTGLLGERDGRFGLLSIGTDYLVNQGLAVGLMVQVDRASEEIDGFSDVSGTGWLAGPYLSMELAPDLFFSARAAWGQSSNDASIDIGGEMYDGSFSTDRRLARAMLYGKFDMGQTRLTPSAQLTYMRESQDDYTVSNGIVTTSVTGVEAELWRLSMATDIETPMQLGDGSMIFFARPQLDWTFDSSGSDVPERASGSIELGLRTGPESTWRGEVAIGYDGIGQPDFEAFSARALLSLRF